MKKIAPVFLIALFGLILAGCSTTEKILPLHDEVLTYELPYDLTYLRALDALNAQSGWLLEQTDKEKGIIKVRNIEYSRLDDADLRTLAFRVKRIDRTHTSVALAPESQRSLNGGDLLEAVDAQLRREL